MDTKKFSQKEVNRIVASRLKRERERLTREYETHMKRCMASIHLILHQEIGTWRRDRAAETQDPFDPNLEFRSGRPVPSEAPGQSKAQREEVNK